jgi:serine/threonine protein kinase
VYPTAGYNWPLTLPPGARLGPYEILALLGAGGMGEVYRAHDTRLNRGVAIKVLPPAFTSDAERRRRFEQEARAAAALSHPSVVAVFDVGVDGGVPYVVSELLEGEDLRRVLSRGPLPPRKAVDIAAQVAHGLAAAHQKRVVHRDLKPENIFITPDGRAKILDFGLAKLVTPPLAHEGDTELPSRHATEPGVVLGTAGYMSPEQVRGEEADPRTDIFAFGAVFYEMLSGRRAFHAATSVDTLTAILRDDPPPISESHVPVHLERLVRRCLEKNPAERFQSAGDIAYALEALPMESGAAQPRRTAFTLRPWLPLLVFGVAAFGLLAAGFGLSRLTAEPEVLTFETRTFDRRPITNARFLPDGKSIVYSAPPSRFSPELFVIYPDAEAPQPLGVTEAHLLAVSSRGELAILTGARHLEQRLFSGTLSRMTIGSSPRPALQDVREADWSPDGADLAVVHDLGNGRDRLEFPAGHGLYEASGYLSDPRVSPDGSRVAFFEHQWRFDDRGWVKVVDRTGTVTTLSGELWGLQGLAWTPVPNTIVFSGSAAGGSVLEPMVVDASGRGSKPRPAFGVPGRFIVHDVAKDGTWLAVREDLALGVRARVPGQDAERELSWLGSSGARGLSADGQWLLMVDVGRRGGRDYSVVMRKTDGSQTLRLGAGFPQALSPDGTRAAAITAEPPQLLLYPTGAGEPARLDRGGLDRITSASWFPDGTRLFVCGAEPSRAPRCYEQQPGGAPSPVTPEGVVGTLAPDGRTLLLTQPDGSFQVAPLNGGAARAVSGLTPADRLIAWSRDSRAVYVQRGLQSPATVERVHLESGARLPVRQLAPEGIGAVATLYVQDWQEDGPWYAYNYTSLPSTLFVVHGAMR